MIKLSKKRKEWASKRSTALVGKPLEYNASIQSRYESLLKQLFKKMEEETRHKLTKLFKNETAKTFFKEEKQRAAMDASITSQAKKLMNELMRKYGQLFNKKSAIFANRMVDQSAQVSASTLHQSFKKLSGLSVKTSIVPKGMEEIAKAVVSENVQLIRSIPKKYFLDVYNSVMRSITTGAGLADLLPDLRRYKGITERRIKNLALDQTRKAYNGINKQRMMAVGVKKFRWLHSAGGQFPRKDHIEMSGNIYSFDDLPVIDKRTGEKGIPGQAINCFVGSTKVSLANGCRNLWRYIHEGEITTITIHGGTIIECTPNHPILTLRGWLSANEIQEGDYLVGTQSNDIGGIDNKDTINNITFEQFFNSSSVFNVHTSFASKFNFHGDIPKKNVDTIIFDNKLPPRIEPVTNEQLEKFIFTLSDIMRDFDILRFNPEIVELSFSSGFRESGAFFLSKFTHSSDISLTGISQDNSIIFQNSCDNLSRAIEKSSDIQNTFIINIKRDDKTITRINKKFIFGCGNKIIESFSKGDDDPTSANIIFNREFSSCHSVIKKLYRVQQKSVRIFSGHVYTLESENGWYSVESTEIISKNCRCRMVPIIELDNGEEV